jgi:hypothetical protein
MGMTRGQREAALRDEDLVDNLDAALELDETSYAARVADGSLYAELAMTEANEEQLSGEQSDDNQVVDLNDIPLEIS